MRLFCSSFLSCPCSLCTSLTHLPRRSNASRGGIVDEHDLFEALSSRTIAGAALDALDTEPPTKEAYGKTFYTLDNIILTPHIGAATHEIQALSACTVIDQLAKLLKGEEIENIVP
jgi:D-3-phosphoglycerate dehydrogenase